MTNIIPIIINGNYCIYTLRGAYFLRIQLLSMGNRKIFKLSQFCGPRPMKIKKAVQKIYKL